MLDHRFLLISLLAAFLVLSAGSRFQHPTAAAASHLPLIEVEPGAVLPDGE